MISAYEPFFGALAFGSGAGVGTATDGCLVTDEAGAAAGRVDLDKEDGVGDGRVPDAKDAFLVADNTGLSFRDRGVLVVGVGLADPV